MRRVNGQWTILVAVNAILAGYFGCAFLAPASSVKTALLPGKTTHGHYQIELDCRACHTPGVGVQQEACLNCHQQELRLANDTHPASKFNDPTNADRLEILDARQCTTCHREHVEDQTLEMGLTLPSDYCYHCHQETLEARPSHATFAFDSCATSGCHNYHDNRALYENFLLKHSGEADFLDEARTAARPPVETSGTIALSIAEADFPAHATDDKILSDWAATQHAAAGVNCQDCHAGSVGGGEQASWSDRVSHETCATCHADQVNGFLSGRHGMRLRQDLPAMKPSLARIPMHRAAWHKKLDCSACHSDHRFDTRYAAVEACLQCHSDEHSLAFQQTTHFALWQQELSGDLPVGSGVSCATCHMPRRENEHGDIIVEHNQNNNLRPNEKMIREVCMNCHGLQFSLDSLADRALIAQCYGATPSEHVKSIDMAKAWFDEREKQKQERLKRRQTQ